ncbi:MULTISPECIES: hypothetical protein [unclassified Sulfitobacter]|uniref:hypothetical protein n=1 Tax=unclassified Sulfitobacter TaxID=196795 RepID=UPI003745DBE3
MKLLWSPHSTGPAARVVSYLMSDRHVAQIAGTREVVLRKPVPELIAGDGHLVAGCIEALETRHRYSCATLSFAPDEIDMVAWRSGDPELRRKTNAALALWAEVAWSGIAPEARPPMLAGTHLHAGHLEINILVPRALFRKVYGKVVPRAWNPHPPTGESCRIWDAYQDAVNHAYGWHDPGDPHRTAAIGGPSWVLKRAAALDRWAGCLFTPDGDIAGGDADRVAAEDPKVQIMLAARILARCGVGNREALLAGIEPVLADLGWRIDHLRPDSIALCSEREERDQRLILHGALCHPTPPTPDPAMVLARQRILSLASGHLAEAMSRRADDARRILHRAFCRPPAPADPMGILRGPSPTSHSIRDRLARRVRDILDRIAAMLQQAQVTDALTRWAERPGGGFGAARDQISELANMPPINIPDFHNPQQTPAPSAEHDMETPTP